MLPAALEYGRSGSTLDADELRVRPERPNIGRFDLIDVSDLIVTESRRSRPRRAFCPRYQVLHWEG